MKLNRTHLTFGLGVFAGAALGAVIMFVALTPPFTSCVETTIKEFPSPDDTSVAAVVVPDCGATTAFATAVRLRYIGQESHIDYVFLVKGQNQMEIVWENKSDFTIYHQRPERIYRQVLVWGMQRIGYREKP